MAILGPSFPQALSKTPISTLCEGLRIISDFHTFDDDLITVLGELERMTLVLNTSIMDLGTIDRTVAYMQYHLLSIHSAVDKSSPNALLEGSLTVGALVYIHTVHRFHLYPQGMEVSSGLLTARVIIQKLKTCLDSVDMNVTQTSGLFLWMMFLGGIAVAGTEHRVWFVARIAKTVVQLQISEWEDVKSLLIRFPWVERIHNKPCTHLWNEVEITVRVLFGDGT